VSTPSATATSSEVLGRTGKGLRLPSVGVGPRPAVRRSRPGRARRTPPLWATFVQLARLGSEHVAGRSRVHRQAAHRRAHGR
jgi:hypothetical protein